MKTEKIKWHQPVTEDPYNWNDGTKWPIPFDEVLSLYLCPADADQIYSQEDFINMVNILNGMPEQHSFEFFVRQFFQNGTLEATKYWAIITAQKMRSTVNPACCLTGQKTNLRLIHVDSNSIGYEYDNLDSLAFISSILLSVYKPELIRNMLIDNFTKR